MVDAVGSTVVTDILRNFLCIILFVYLGCTGPSLLCGLFSSCSEWGLFSRCGAQVASLVAEHGL